ncbi:uncharacterized protein LOC111615673 [Centruroides sculpturatus]|uniref:uncharacterized protein LOC111615673 n=1 Tax=Centruroides sculpturatus TaxID=218467 RepID=UPI000C6EB4AC|nr:uncharacterized protein LOC111615673 [Centruroides sculpturatus]
MEMTSMEPSDDRSIPVPSTTSQAIHQDMVNGTPVVTGYLGMIPMFSSSPTDSVTIEQFFDILEEVSSIAGWDNGTRLVVAQSRLKNEPFKLLMDLRAVYGKDYVRIKTALVCSLHRPTTSEGNTLKDFISIRQRRSETVGEYKVCLCIAFEKMICSNPHMATLRDEMLRSQFVQGLTLELRMKLLERDPQSFDSAVEVAERLYNIEQSCGFREVQVGGVVVPPFNGTEDPSKESTNMAELSAKLASLEETVTKLSQAVMGLSVNPNKHDTNEQTKRAGPERKCFICKSKDHLCSNCPLNLNSELIIDLAEEPKINDHKLPIISGEINGRTVSLLIDTGAERSLINQGNLESLGSADHQCNVVNVRVKGVSGGIMRCDRSFLFKVKFGGKVVPTQFIGVDSGILVGNHGILGMDFLCACPEILTKIAHIMKRGAVVAKGSSAVTFVSLCKTPNSPDPIGQVDLSHLPSEQAIKIHDINSVSPPEDNNNRSVNDRVIASQQLDSRIIEIRDTLLKGEVGNTPTNLQDFEVSNNLLIKNGLNYRGEPVKCLCVGDTMQIPLIEHYHEMGGHSGAEKTLKKMRGKYFFPNMKRKIKHFINRCEICQKFNRTTHKVPIQEVTHPNEPMQVIAVDVIGPVPESRRGNRYIIVFIDMFTRFIEAIPVPEVSSKTIADSLFENIVCRYGGGQTLISDRGTNLTSKIMNDACNILNIDRKLTTAYRPTSNGTCERANKTIIEMISRISNGDNADWDKYIPSALLAYRTTIHSSTGETPSFLLYGFDPVIPGEPRTTDMDQDAKSALDYREKLIRKLHVCREAAEVFNKEQLAKKRAYWNKNRRLRKFRVGDLVLIKKPSKVTHKKFSAWHTGPFRVEEVLNDVVVRMERRGSEPLPRPHSVAQAYLPQDCRIVCPHEASPNEL